MYERKTKTKFQKISKAVAVASAFVVLITLSYSTDKSAIAVQAVDNPLITYTNQSRSESDLDPVLYNSILTLAAQDKAEDIINNQYFEHTRSDGKQPWDFMKENGYSYRFAGENLAIGYSDYAQMHEALLNSPTHRRNILNSRYNEIGIGVAEGLYEGDEVVVVVEMFGGH